MKTKYLQIIAVLSGLILLMLIFVIITQKGNNDVANTTEIQTVDVVKRELLEIRQTEGYDAKKINPVYDVYKNKMDIDLGQLDKNYKEEMINNCSSYAKKINITEKNKTTHIIVDLSELCGYTTFIKNNCIYLHFESVKKTSKKVVVLDAGHGGSDVGAASGSIYEKDINLSVVKYIKKNICKSYLVLLTREGDSLPSVEARADFVNKVKPDIFVSIHCNDSNIDTASGIEVLYNQNDTRKRGSKLLAKTILKNIVNTTGADNRGIIHGREIHIVRSSVVPVALVEIGFMSNKKEVKNLKTKEYQKKCALGVSNAIYEILDKNGEKK